MLLGVLTPDELPHQFAMSFPTPPFQNNDVFLLDILLTSHPSHIQYHT